MDSLQPIEEWVSVPEAAQITGVSRATIFRLLKANELPSKRIGEGKKARAVLVNVQRLMDVYGGAVQHRPEVVQAAAGPSLAVERVSSLSAGNEFRLEQFLALAELVRAGGADSGPLYVSLSAAAEITGLPQSHLLRLAKSGGCKAFKTGLGWRFHRPSLVLL